MKLSVTEAKKTILEPANSDKISEVKKYESSLRVYTEEMEEGEIKDEHYWKKLTESIKTKSVKKYNRITDFMRFPLPIVQVTDSILSDFYKVFEGKNRYFNFIIEREASTLTNWIKETNPEKWIEEKARKIFKNTPSTIVVIDRDENGYPYLLDISLDRIVDISINKSGLVNYITFVHSKGKNENGKSITKYSVYDEEYYRVFTRIEESEVMTIEVEIPHGLGYCPARSFLTSTTNDKNYLKRRSAFGASLSKLNDWTTFDIYQNFMDHYVPFPVTETPVRKCTNPKCNNGKVKKIINVNQNEKKEVYEDCGVCKRQSDGDLIGPGTVIKINLKADKDKEDGSGKFKIHFPETSNMDYIPNKLEKLEREIRYKTVGISNLLSKEAVNTLQVKGSFAGMETILIRNKEELDLIYKWIVETVCKLFYGNIPVTVEANYGTEFYLLSEEQLQLLFDNAKKIGLPKEEIKAIYNQLIHTKYKGNTEKIKRHKMLMDLDPYCVYTDKECLELNKSGVIDMFDLTLKVNFTRFIGRFERENSPITEFGINLPYTRIIEVISEELERYNKELIDKKAEREPKPSPNNTGEPVE